MKKDLHPKINEINLICNCGNKIKIFSTINSANKISVDVCCKCHPFYTGINKVIDTAGRVEKFNKKYNLV